MLTKYTHSEESRNGPAPPRRIKDIDMPNNPINNTRTREMNNSLEEITIQRGPAREIGNFHIPKTSTKGTQPEKKYIPQKEKAISRGT